MFGSVHKKVTAIGGEIFEAVIGETALRRFHNYA